VANIAKKRTSVMRYALFFITICFHIRLMMPVCLSLFLQNTGKHTGTGQKADR